MFDSFNQYNKLLYFHSFIFIDKIKQIFWLFFTKIDKQWHIYKTKVWYRSSREFDTLYKLFCTFFFSSTRHNQWLNRTIYFLVRIWVKLINTNLFSFFFCSNCNYNQFVWSLKKPIHKKMLSCARRNKMSLHHINSCDCMQIKVMILLLFGTIFLESSYKKVNKTFNFFFRLFSSSIA